MQVHQIPPNQKIQMRKMTVFSRTSQKENTQKEQWKKKQTEALLQEVKRSFRTNPKLRKSSQILIITVHQ